MHRRLRLPVLATVVALLASSCGGGGTGDPLDEVTGAFERTLDGSFAWEAKVELGDDFATAQGVPPQVLGMIESARLNGVKTPDGASFEVSLSGIRMFEFRGLDEGRTGYVRTGLAQAAQVFGGFSPEDLAADAGLAELPPQAKELFDALFAGQWLGFEDIDVERFQEQQRESYEQLGLDFQVFQALGEQLKAEFADLDRLLAKVTEIVDEGDGRYRLDLRTEAIVREGVRIFRPIMEQFAETFGGPPLDDADLEADIQEMLTQAPTRLRGLSVLVEDGVVHEIRFDVGELAAGFPEAGADAPRPGDVVILLVLDEHGAVAEIEAPEDARVFTEEELLELQELLMDPSLMIDPTLAPDAGDIEAEAA